MNIHLEIMPPYLTIIVGAQWLSGRVLDLRPRAPGSSLTASQCCFLSGRLTHINPSLELVQHRKSCPDVTERLLTGT